MSVFYKKNAMAILLSIILVYAAGCGQGNAESLEMNQEAGDVTKTVNVQEEINAQGTAGEQEDPILNHRSKGASIPVAIYFLQMNLDQHQIQSLALKSVLFSMRQFFPFP